MIVINMNYELRIMNYEWIEWGDQLKNCLAHWGWAGDGSDVNISTGSINISN